MNVTVKPWRDPAFFWFLLAGLLLIASSALCSAHARHATVASAPAPHSLLLTEPQQLLSPGLLPPPAAPRHRGLDTFTF